MPLCCTGKLANSCFFESRCWYLLGKTIIRTGESSFCEIIFIIPEWQKPTRCNGNAIALQKVAPEKGNTSLKSSENQSKLWKSAIQNSPKNTKFAIMRNPCHSSSIHPPWARWRTCFTLYWLPQVVGQQMQNTQIKKYCWKIWQIRVSNELQNWMCPANSCNAETIGFMKVLPRQKLDKILVLCL